MRGSSAEALLRVREEDEEVVDIMAGAHFSNFYTSFPHQFVT